MAFADMQETTRVWTKQVLEVSSAYLARFKLVSQFFFKENVWLSGSTTRVYQV